MRRLSRRRTRSVPRATRRRPTTCRRRPKRTAPWKRPIETRRKTNRLLARSGSFEVDPFHHWQALQLPPQAIEPKFNGAKPNPITAAQYAGAAELEAARRCDADPDRAAEIDTIRAVIEFNQYRQGMR